MNAWLTLLSGIVGAIILSSCDVSGGAENDSSARVQRQEVEKTSYPEPSDADLKDALRAFHIFLADEEFLLHRAPDKVSSYRREFATDVLRLKKKIDCVPSARAESQRWLDSVK